MIQKQPPEVFCKKCVLKNFAKFTGKHQSLFFNKVAGLKTPLTKVLSCEFCEIFKNTFLRNTSGTTASGDFNYPCTFPQVLFSIKKNGNLKTSKTLNWEENQQQLTFLLVLMRLRKYVRWTYFIDNTFIYNYLFSETIILVLVKLLRVSKILP